LKTLGANRRLARLRRNLTILDIAQKIGTTRCAVADSEKGKPSTSVVIYAALLWAYGLIDQLSDLADPTRDEQGSTLALDRKSTMTSEPPPQAGLNQGREDQPLLQARWLLCDTAQ
jgi:transcriptional regulator with XRE-family HTH domain